MVKGDLGVSCSLLFLVNDKLKVVIRGIDGVIRPDAPVDLLVQGGGEAVAGPSGEDLAHFTINSRHAVNKPSPHDAGLAFTYSIGFTASLKWSSRVSYPCAAFRNRNTNKQ